MKNRLLTGWNFRRIMYLALGVLMIVQSIILRQWWGMAFGGYFASMGLFAFGCAGGNCTSGYCRPPRRRATNLVDKTDI
jgi:hypothetical protein